ncbi:hypothetical protein [Pantanalinema sp. GBBB05]|uniref:hypothetical protein n=1 Tax=Pantanalinema sp. GBBB05 TaxID=2604139 RepID=UPI001D6D759F|nr:hypothetical protein [Pantanalinema sp. GBBB05]
MSILFGAEDDVLKGTIAQAHLDPRATLAPSRLRTKISQPTYYKVGLNLDCSIYVTEPAKPHSVVDSDRHKSDGCIALLRLPQKDLLVSPGPTLDLSLLAKLTLLFLYKDRKAPPKTLSSVHYIALLLVGSFPEFS